MAEKESPILPKSYAFSLRMVKLYKHLCGMKPEFVSSKEMLVQRTGIGAHVKASQEASGREGFIREMDFANQRAMKPESWLELLRDGRF